MKKIVSAFLVVAFSLTPAIANADTYVDIQGGTPQYSCPDGSTLQGTKCSFPETTTQEEVTTNTRTYAASSTQDGVSQQWVQSGWCANEDAYCYYYKYTEMGCTSYWYDSGWQVVNAHWLCSQPNYVYSCPEGGVVSGSNCINAPETTIQTVVNPPHQIDATIAGSTGGSVVASVGAFFNPIWNFLTTTYLGAVFGFILLGITVLITIKAVKKYSRKVA